jgi:hypothetical protein
MPELVPRWIGMTSLNMRAKLRRTSVDVMSDNGREPCSSRLERVTSAPDSVVAQAEKRHVP